MTRGVNSAFFNALQQDTVLLTELITLETPNGNWYWTTNNNRIVSSGQTYVPFPGGTGDGIEESTDLGIATIDFIFSNSGGEFDELLNGQELDMATIDVDRVFTNSPDLGRMGIYSGRLGDYSYDRRQVYGQARDKFDGVNIKWPYYTYMDQCAWRFGSTGCGFDTSTIINSGQLVSDANSKLTIKAASGDFTSSAYQNGHFDRGRVTILSGANSGSVRTVRTHSGDAFDLSHGLPFSVTSGDFFTVFRGCRKRLVEDCNSVFDNTSNFLGFPWIPRQENAF